MNIRCPSCLAIRNVDINAGDKITVHCVCKVAYDAWPDGSTALNPFEEIRDKHMIEITHKNDRALRHYSRLTLDDDPPNHSN